MSNAGIGHDPAPAVDRPIQDDRVPADPIALLTAWLPHDEDPVRPTATLATVDADGMPNARTVLLSSFANGRAAFHTDATSTKARELREEPVAALALFWGDLGRQVVLRGPVVRTSAETDRLAFSRRSRYLQLLAWMNTPDTARAPRAARERAWSEFDAEHQVLSPPHNWVGYELIPDSLIFWEGSARGPGRRVRYTRQGPGWQHEILPG